MASFCNHIQIIKYYLFTAIFIGMFGYGFGQDNYSCLLNNTWVFTYQGNEQIDSFYLVPTQPKYFEAFYMEFDSTFAHIIVPMPCKGPEMFKFDLAELTDSTFTIISENPEIIGTAKCFYSCQFISCNKVIIDK